LLPSAVFVLRQIQQTTTTNRITVRQTANAAPAIRISQFRLFSLLGGATVSRDIENDVGSSAVEAW